MRPLDRDLARACTIELFYHPFGKFRLIKFGIDDDPLPLFGIDADLGEQFCIALEL